MRSLALRCVVVLLSLALISGNAHAELHLGAVPHDPCPAELGHDHGGTSKPHNGSADQSCCCDCLGCVSAIEITPDLSSSSPAFFTAAIYYGPASVFLTGQTLRPDPGPPRSGAPS